MKSIIIQTESMGKMTTAIDSTLGGITGFIVGQGQAGRGKTEALKYYHANSDSSVYIKVRGGLTQPAFLQRVLFEVQGNNGDLPRYNGNKCKDLIVKNLNDNKKALLIDEADRLHIDRIEDLRDILDESGTPVVLVGEENLEYLLSQRRRVWSRVVEEIHFEAISAAEVGAYAMKTADLDIPPDLCLKITEKADGDFRLVRNMMLLFEKTAKATSTYKVDATMVEDVFALRSWRRG